jgi:parvulin-like peptidyl-prolyl isomerase
MRGVRIRLEPGYSCYSARVQVIRSSALICLLVSLVACQNADSKLSGEIGSGSGSAGVQPGSGSGSAKKPSVPDVDLDSKDILGRTTAAPQVYVKHVLIAWADLLPAYRGRLDPRAAKRTNADAAKLAKEIADKLKAAPDSIDALVKEHSEDPGSQSGSPYPVNEKSQFVPQFKKLALRLNEKEVGIVKTSYGYHVMERVGKPPLDPAESADILKRDKKTELAEVQHVLVGFKESTSASDPRAKTRSKDDAAKLAKEILDKIKKGEDMAKLMKEYSEDPGSKDSARSYTVTEEEQLVEGFKELSLRLDMGEAGIVKTDFGFHVMKRIKPDPLQSADILARPVAEEKPKIKYILVGWKDAHINDKRGEGRDRATLEKVVKDTLAKLKSGTKFEDLMKELSEDPQTGQTGAGLDASIPGLPSMMKMIGQRLKMDEVGVVKTQFGMFIIKRVNDVSPTNPPAGSGSAAKPPKPAGSGAAEKPAGSAKPVQPAGSARPAGSAAPKQ